MWGEALLELEAGTVVANRYRITRPLGRGGMGEVFAAENIRTGRQVAVKLLRSDSKTKSSAVARFRREARAAGSINSDHVTQVLDVEEDPEHGIVLVFELLEGESLIDRLKRTGPIDFDELHPIIEQVWMGLADAHRAGIIHRDLKPSNVFLEARPDGTTRVKILDFGISKLPKEMGGETLTEMGQSLGTFSFMPPEQIGKAKTVDHRADIYACTTLIYQAITGQLPYQARNILIMVEMKTKTDARKLAEVMDGPIDARLESFLAMGLARDPAQRFQSAVEGLNAWRELRPQGVASQPSSTRAPHTPRPLSGPASSTSSALRGSLVSPMPPRPPIPLTAGTGLPRIPVAPELPMVAEPMLDTPPDMSDTVVRSGGAHEPLPQTVREPQSTRSELLQQPQKPPTAYVPGPYLSTPWRRTGPYGTALLEQSGGGTVQPVQPFASPPASSHRLPIIYDDTSSGGSPSQEQTHVYQPSRASFGSMSHVEPPADEAVTLQPNRPVSASQRARALGYVVAAVACAVVGFIVVAIALRVLNPP
jgi:eukaryotic-like serine/threonine-protein kinase